MIKSSLIKKLLKNNPHLIQKDIEIIVDTVLENIGETLSRTVSTIISTSF